MLILKSLVLEPPAFSALTLKLNILAAVGVPLISPVLVFRLKPDGRLPLSIDHEVGLLSPPALLYKLRQPYRSAGLPW